MCIRSSGSLHHLPTKYDFGWWTPVSDTEIFCLELFNLQMFALHFCLSVSSLDVISDLICTWSLQRREKLYIASSSICVLSDVIKLLVGAVQFHWLTYMASVSVLSMLHCHCHVGTPWWKCFAMCSCVLSKALWIACRSAVSQLQTELLCFPSAPATSWFCFLSHLISLNLTGNGILTCRSVALGGWSLE